MSQATGKILIVDDSRVARMAIKEIFRKNFPDVLLSDVGSPKEAIDLSKSETFELASLDYNMPDMNGIELGVELRKIQPNMKIAILTANIQKAVFERSEGHGFYFFKKPIQDELICNLIALLNSP
jgi:CheY-like chemotaxis protein